MNLSRVVLVGSAPILAAFLLLFGGACGSDGTTANNPGSSSGSGGDGGAASTGGMTGSGGILNTGGTTGTGGMQLNPCGNDDPSCEEECFGPTCNPKVEFPMPEDDPAPDNVTTDGVTKDKDGYIVLDSTKAQSDNLWVADDMNYNVGFVSKVHTKPFPNAPTYREIGRYVSVTCFSDPVKGSKEGAVLGQSPPGGLCADGENGCCARDAAGGAGKAIKLISNRPSRTAVDLNGDVWVANRAFGGQASTTKIANDINDCIDRNGNNQIDTSSDVNNDGIITTDCDDNNLPDDINTVCAAGKSHEFFGLDDECILFTVNIGASNAVGRPLTLGPDPNRPTGPSDAWAGLYYTGQFFRIDGVSGLVENTVQITPQNNVSSRPYGAAVDFYGILWAPNVNSGNLFYFDTNQPDQQGMVTYPGGGFYGIAIDGYTVQEMDEKKLIQQIWMGDYSGGAGAGAFRYRPIRDQGFWGLGQGTWAKVVFDKDPNTSGYEIRQGRGLGADNRSPVSFVWLALDGLAAGGEGHVGRIPIDIPDNALTKLGPNEMFASTQQGMTGAGVAADLDVWGVNQSNSSVVHYGVDPAGNVVSGPDIIPLNDNPKLSGSYQPHPYTYSDFTGFGLRNFTNPQGYYAYVLSGNCPAGKTDFLKVTWDAETPTGTAVTMIARSSNDLNTLDSATWTPKYETSPANLKGDLSLSPNPSGHIEVLFELTTDGEESPKLKSFNIIYQCESSVPAAR